MSYGNWGKYLPVIGRTLLGLLFLVAGVFKFGGIAGVAGAIAKAGLPMPEALAWATAIIETVGGAMLILGFHARIGAWLLIGFTALTVIFIHPFWSDASQQTMAMKNLAIIGGLLFVAKYGSGMWSIRSSGCKCCDEHSCKTCDADGAHGR